MNDIYIPLDKSGGGSSNTDTHTFQKKQCDVPDFDIGGVGHQDWDITTGVSYLTTSGGQLRWGVGGTYDGTATRVFKTIPGTSYTLNVGVTAGQAGELLIEIFNEDGSIIATENIDIPATASPYVYTFTPTGDSFNVKLTDLSVPPETNNNDYITFITLDGLNRGDATEFFEVYDIAGAVPVLLNTVDADGNAYTPSGTVMDCPEPLDVDAETVVVPYEVDTQCYEAPGAPDTSNDSVVAYESTNASDFQITAPVDGTISSIFIRLRNTSATAATLALNPGAGLGGNTLTPSGAIAGNDEVVVEYTLGTPVVVTAGQVLGINPVNSPTIDMAEVAASSGFNFTFGSTANMAGGYDAGYGLTTQIVRTFSDGVALASEEGSTATVDVSGGIPAGWVECSTETAAVLGTSYRGIYGGGNDYLLGDLVYQGGRLHRALADFTSVGGFSSANWETFDQQNGSQNFNRTGNFSASILDNRATTIYNFTGAGGTATIGTDTIDAGDGNSETMIIMNTGGGSLNLNPGGGMTYTGPASLGSGEAAYIVYINGTTTFGFRMTN